MYTAQEVLDYVREENVKFIRLAYCDVRGRTKNLTIMPGELPRAFEEGICIDASAIDGFADAEQSDLYLSPDPSTMAVVPWHSIHGKMIRMYCFIKRPDGSACPCDSRALLQSAVQGARARGLACSFGTEFEFYLFKADEDNQCTDIPYDSAGYMDIDPGDKCEAIRREICITLMDMGILPEAMHHAQGPGQNEIVFACADPLTAADNAVTFKSVARTVCIRSGLYANFSPKPLPSQSGNGLHVSLSVSDTGGRDPFEPFMAGILTHIEAMTAFLNPTVQSYLRLGQMKAPRVISWAPENRSQLMRVPVPRAGVKRLELRSPDPGANPYVAFALLIRAGLDGIENSRPLMPPTSANLHTANQQQLSGLRPLPESLAQARTFAQASKWLRSVLPAPFWQF